MDEIKKIGEVVEASTGGFTAECYKLYEIPPLGSLVRAGDSSLDPMESFSIVCSATTSSIEPGRHPIARGREEASEKDLYDSNPQLLKLFRSEFTTLSIGSRQDGRFHHYLPPKPARIHSFVYSCSNEEVREFSRSFSFLNILLNSRLDIPAEELVAACLCRMSEAQEDPKAFLVSAGRELAVLLSSDFSRFKAILERIKSD